MDQKIYWHPTKLVLIKQKRIEGQRTTEGEASRTSRVKAKKLPYDPCRFGFEYSI
jgi:hypothetical protein